MSVIVYRDGSYVQNGSGHGATAEALAEVGFDPGLYRPFIDDAGHRCVIYKTGRMVKNSKGALVPERKKIRVKDARDVLDVDLPIWNATTLRPRQWIQYQDAVLAVTRKTLRAWTDLRNIRTISGFDGMSKMTYEYTTANDPGEAVVDMEGLADPRSDEPVLNFKSVPLPITQAGWWFSRRRMRVAAGGGFPLDTRMAEACGRRVAEMIEKTLIGIETGVTYGTRSTGIDAHTGTSTAYGYTNFPYRVTKTDLTTPTGTNPDQIMTDVLEMIQLLQDLNFTGPYILYVSTGYSRYLNDDYFRSGSTSAVRTVRERVMEIEGIQDIRRLDYLTSGFQMILVQADERVGAAIDGMGIQTVQWETKGGNQINFRVMTIQTPVLFADNNGVAPIVHGTTS